MKNRYAKISVRMVERIGAGLISYQEFAVWAYMLTYCGTKDGQKNPYKRGKKGITDTFQISAVRAQKILKSLEQAGVVEPVYRVRLADSSEFQTKSWKQAWKVMKTGGGRIMNTFYRVHRVPKTMSVIRR